jgi:hypothetical protein
MGTAHGRELETLGEPPQPSPRRLQGLLLTVVSVVLGVVFLLASRILGREFGVIGGMIIYVIAGLGFVIASAGFRRGKQMRARPAAEVLVDDPRPPVLYLRSFVADGGEFSGMFFMHRSYEEHLVRALEHAGPVVTVGSPAETASLPTPGAARMYLRDDTWRARVDTLISQSGLIAMHAGTSPGVVWELRRVVEANRPERLILCLPVDPATTSKKHLTAEARFQQFRAATVDLFPRPLPLHAGRHAFMYFQSDWTPVLLEFSPGMPGGSSTQAVALRKLAKEFKRRVHH